MTTHYSFVQLASEPLPSLIQRRQGVEDSPVSAEATGIAAQISRHDHLLPDFDHPRYLNNAGPLAPTNLLRIGRNIALSAVLLLIAWWGEVWISALSDESLLGNIAGPAAKVPAVRHKQNRRSVTVSESKLTKLLAVGKPNLSAAPASASPVSKRPPRRAEVKRPAKPAREIAAVPRAAAKRRPAANEQAPPRTVLRLVPASDH